jgi:hypothetical protein
MTIHKDLSVPYHQQDTDYYCGAACAQMVLAQVGAGLLDQVPLYNDNHSHSIIESNWYTAPDGLQWTLNNRHPPAFTGWFALFALGSEDAISRKLVWTIHHYNVAPVALVYGSNHWIVIRGYDASAEPASSSDTTYSISGFYVNNPWPPVPATPPPPPHNNSDGCGSGGVRGIADEHIAYAAWQSTYMTGVPGGHWQGQFVAVCDPEPPPNQMGKPPPLTAPRSGDALVTADDAAKLAVAGLKEYGLEERESWSNHLIKAKAKPGEPVLVQRLDREDSFYYIVPMQGPRRSVPVLVLVDGRFGNYLQSVALNERDGNLLDGLDFKPQAALRGILGKTQELGSRHGRILVRKEAHCLYPTLVWRPCRESLSPFYPFHMLTVGNHRIYIRVDGKVFTKLHTSDRGI